MPKEIRIKRKYRTLKNLDVTNLGKDELHFLEEGKNSEFWQIVSTIIKDNIAVLEDEILNGDHVAQELELLTKMRSYQVQFIDLPDQFINALLAGRPPKLPSYDPY